MNSKLFLIIITLIAFFIRSYRSEFPPLLWDEASIGYNAYSIIKTGADEYGQKFPLIFKSFGDYKPGLYIYLAAPFVADLGLNALAVRLPSIIIGSLTPLLLFLFIRHLIPNSKFLAVISAVILTFNPYNIHFSRGAWETNLLTFELLLGSYLFFKQKYIFSSLVFGMTLFTYQGGKIMSPLLILILLILNFKTFKQYFLKFFLPLIIFAIPIAYGLLSGSDSNRLQVFSLWSYPRSEFETQQLLSESNRLDYQLFHNQLTFFTSGFVERYLNNFSPRFLAFEGDWQIARHNAPYIGFILFPSLIFLVIGLFSGNFKKIHYFFLFWLLVAPLSAALTRDSIQPVRSMSFSIPLVFFISLGINFIISKYPSLLLKIFIFLIYCLSFVYYSDLYLNHFARIKPHENLVGYRESVDYVKHFGAGKKITFTPFYGQSYIYYLFYSQYDPVKYQSQANLIVSGLDTGKIESIDSIQFKTPDYSQLKTTTNNLAIFSIDEVYRQNIDINSLTKLSPIFYAFQN